MGIPGDIGSNATYRLFSFSGLFSLSGLSGLSGFVGFSGFVEFSIIFA